ncbi:MAG: YHYH protein [Aquiluna sp.]|nr:YHYH protein [Aquiluna sp.]MCF8545258.1 YHYH protein [Aquiluna sp.]
MNLSRFSIVALILIALTGCTVSNTDASLLQENSPSSTLEIETESTEGTIAGSESSGVVGTDGSASAEESGNDEEQSTHDLDGDHLGNYTLIDNEYGTDTTVTVTATTRTIVSNALPNHETGTFPNSGNPNTIQAQNRAWELPLEINYTGTPTAVRETGVGLNGVKFEPGTAEVAVCETGESYPIEGLQEIADLGMDFNNAHVQPNGEYHYHGVSGLMVEIFSTNNDLVHVGFAQDGGLIYYSKSGAFASSYLLGTDTRAGDNCTYTAGKKATISFGDKKDGALTTDWEFKEGSGDLDACNGTFLDGEYVYFLTNEFPYIPRCLMGKFTESPLGSVQPGR